MLDIGNVTFDCADPEALARFWSSVLARPVDDGANAFFASIGIGGPPVRWLFIRVPEGKTAKNRMHLDLEARDRDAAIADLVELGATRVGDHDEHGHTWTTLLDIEGNEFCVSQASRA